MENDMEIAPQFISSAEVCLSAYDLKTEMPFFIEKLGFRLEEIYPADDPSVAVISGHGIRIKLDRSLEPAPAQIVLRVSKTEQFSTSRDTLETPSGHRINVQADAPSLEIPTTEHSFMVRHLQDVDSWVIGRAGMHYRDLIPDRLGGSIIASHIRIPDGGPVPDMVHYHTVGFQLIFCYRGWVRLVYEDQGEPFILTAGDCVIQPPEIRHRVLEASDNVEVLEIGVPAEHITTIDHDMELPNPTLNPEREWSGTRFVHFLSDQVNWKKWRIPGWEFKDTGIGEATRGIAGVHVCRPANSLELLGREKWTHHNTDILFTFVKEGAMTLEVKNEKPVRLGAGDAFVLPPYLSAKYSEVSADCELIETALQADFKTEIVENDAA